MAEQRESLIGVRDPSELVGKLRTITHWMSPADADSFNAVVRRNGHHTETVSFRTARGTSRNAELHARVRTVGGREHGIDAFWRDVTAARLREQAQRTAFQLRDATQSLPDFEKAVAERAAAVSSLGAAAFYRRHSPAILILRAQHGLPTACHLARRIDGDIADDLLIPVGRRLVDAKYWRNHPAAGSDPVRELFVPISGLAGPEGESVIGSIWVAAAHSELSEVLERIRALTLFFGDTALAAENETAQRAKARFLEEAVTLLVSGDPSAFLSRLLDRLIAEVPCEGGSIFANVSDARGEFLQLKWSTGIGGVAPPDWHRITYRLGTGLTGWSALTHHDAIALLDIDEARESNGIAKQAFVEETSHKPATWLGCPVFDASGRLKLYIRLVNRSLGGPGTPPAGFSAGDLRVSEAIAAVAALFDQLQATQREHQSVVASSFHELRAPLVGIRAHANYLADNPETPLAIPKARNVQLDAELLLQLLDDIDLAARDRDPQRRTINLGGQILAPLRDGLGIVAKRRGYSGLVIASQNIRQLPSLWVDRGMFHQVFSNLIVNAIKYGPPPDKNKSLPLQVEVTYERGTPSQGDLWLPAGASELRTAEMFRPDAELLLKIRDWGMGIPAEAAQRIFDRYVREDAARRRDPTGAGIGLFIVRTIVEKHGGKMWVSRCSDPTEFTIALPGVVMRSRRRR